MSGEYVPSNDVIYTALREYLYDEDDPDGSKGARIILAAHDREVIAGALREAAGDMPRQWSQEDGPSDWLDLRADQIASDGQGGEG